MPEPSYRLLLVDDEVHIRQGLAEALRDEDLSVTPVATGEEALERLREREYHVVITDLRMPGRVGGMEVLRAAREAWPEAVVMVITAFGTVDGAVEAMRLGAYDFIAKPLDLKRLRMQVGKAIERLALLAENRRLKVQLRDRREAGEVVAESAGMKRVIAAVEQVAPSDATVFLSGESGTGKEVVARLIHQRSARAGRSFVTVNCGALSETLFESEVFGHEAGAFTGATHQRKGLFEQADGGTLLLDEITEIAEKNQVDLLRVLQEREITRVGGQQRIPVNVRIIASTNQDPAARVSEGRFREDLFYRLNVIPILLPALRERREDVPLLVSAFLEEFCARHERKRRSFSGPAMQALVAHAWPGNVRQLRNLVERLVITAPGEVIGLADLPEELRSPQAAGTTDLREQVRRAEREAILHALEMSGGHRERAAEALGVSVRTLHYKMRALGLT